MADSNRIFPSRREVIEFWSLVVFVIAVPMGLTAVGLIRFPLADENSPLYLRLPLWTLLIGGAALILLRKRLFSPRSRKRKFLLGTYVFGIAQGFGFAALGGFLILNGALDRGARTETTYEVVSLAEPPHAYVRLLGRPDATPVRMDIAKPYWQSGPGAVLVVEKGKGFFGETWVSGRRLAAPGDLKAGRAARAPFSPKSAPGSGRAMLAFILGILLVAWLAERVQSRMPRGPGGGSPGIS